MKGIGERLFVPRFGQDSGAVIDDRVGLFCVEAEYILTGVPNVGNIALELLALLFVVGHAAASGLRILTVPENTAVRCRVAKQ